MDRRLEALRALKTLLDERFRVPGTNLRFGWDPLIGLIPWAGDALTALLGVGVILQAHHLRAPKIVQLRMVFNVVLDLLLGVVPFFGDAIDFFWKSNSRNFALLERHVQARSVVGPTAGPSATAGDWLFVGAFIAVILIVALIPLFVMYWLLNAVGPHLPALSR